MDFSNPSVLIPTIINVAGIVAIIVRIQVRQRYEEKLREQEVAQTREISKQELIQIREIFKKELEILQKGIALSVNEKLYDRRAECGTLVDSQKQKCDILFNWHTKRIEDIRKDLDDLKDDLKE